jgi:hypothetical protein
MSLALATKGVICTRGQAYPLPIERYDVDGEEFGGLFMRGEESGLVGVPVPHTSALDLDPDVSIANNEDLEPKIDITELKPGLRVV